MAYTLAPIGIVLVTHERLGEAFIESVTHILGSPQYALEAVCSFTDPQHDHLRENIQKACERVDLGRGVLLLVDIFGSTPANFCSEIVDDIHIGAMAGVNLPLLLRALSHRQELNLAALMAELENNHNTLIQKLSRRNCHVQNHTDNRTHHQ